MSYFVVIDRNTNLTQAGAFDSKEDAQAHVARLERQWAGAGDEHPGGDYVAVEVPDKP
jgi:hypothetical protein